MSEINDFDFDAPESFTSGDGVQKRLRFEGMTQAIIKDLIPGKSKTSQNYTIKVIAEGLDGPMDEDYPGTGLSLGVALKSGILAVSGEVKSGRNKGRKNVERFFSFVDSAHTFLHEDKEVAEAATAELCGGQLNFKKMKAFLVGKTVAVKVRNTSFFNDAGEEIFYTEMGDAVSRQVYESAQKAGTLRRIWNDPSRTGAAASDTPANGAAGSAMPPPAEAETGAEIDW